MEGSSRAQCYVVQANSGLQEENEDDLRWLAAQVEIATSDILC
jgi:hypothetical protein